MGKIGEETCSVCRENTSKYRCPGCAVLYCSLACNRVHKSGEGGGKPACTGKRPLPGTAINGHGPAQGSDSTSSSQQSSGKRPRSDDCGDDGVQSAPSEACVRMGRDQWRGGREDKEEEEWQMSADQRARMARCAWLKAALRDPKLQALVTEIDKAADREKALTFHRTSAQFGEFMEKLLLEIDEYRKGGPGEPELVAADP